MENAAAGSRWLRWAAFVAVAMMGVAVRLPQLGARPMHTDEAINAYMVGQLLAGEPFLYDPQDRHGPALAALAFPLVKLEGAKTFSDLTESELRLAPVLAGAITILLFGAAAEMFGFTPSLLAALLFAFGPLPVYYDRYFIHESLFCAATFGLILAGWRASRSNFLGYGALAGACAAVMLAAKETAILHFFSMAAACTLVSLFKAGGKSFRQSIGWGQLGTAAGTLVAITGILFTWFGRNVKALPALLLAVPDFVARAGGQGHQKPFWYFGQLLIGGWSGGLLVALACLGLFMALRRRDQAPWQWLAYYGLFITLIYSLIPYKTPWLALNLWLPLALFVALALDALGRWAASKLHGRVVIPVICIFGAAASIAIAHDTRQRVFLHPADEANPYAYAHTTEDILQLPDEIADLARRDGIATPRIAVIAADAWPLPWYLRHYKLTGYWQPGQPLAAADFYVTSTEAAEQYSDSLQDFRPEFFGVRPGVLILLWSPAPK